MFEEEVEMSQFSCFALLIPQAFCRGNVLPVIPEAFTISSDTLYLPLILH